MLTLLELLLKFSFLDIILTSAIIIDETRVSLKLQFIKLLEKPHHFRIQDMHFVIKGELKLTK